MTDQGQRVGQGGNGLIGSAKRHGAEVGGRVVAQAPFPAGQAVQAIIMEDHRLAIGRQLDIKFDRIAPRAGRLERGQRIFQARHRGSTAPCGAMAGSNKRSHASPNTSVEGRS